MKNFWRENRFWIIVFISASIFDAVSTSFGLTQPGTVEFNPLSKHLITDGNLLRTTLYLLAPPVVILGLIFTCWVRVWNKKIWETLIEAGATLQILAGINNTLIYTNHITPIPILLMAGAAGHYATRTHHQYKDYKDHRTIRERLPKALG